jgi:hypothetical protein
VECAVLGTRVWALHRRHLRLVARAAADQEADAVEREDASCS